MKALYHSAFALAVTGPALLSWATFNQAAETVHGNYMPTAALAIASAIILATWATLGLRKSL